MRSPPTRLGRTTSATAAAPASDACSSLRKEERSRLGSADLVVVPYASDLARGGTTALPREQAHGVVAGAPTRLAIG
jgi:hypothetical protein